MNESFSSYFPMDVGKRVMIYVSEGRIWSVVRGWKESDCILVDLPSGDKPSVEFRAGMPCRVRYVREGVLHSFESQVIGDLTFPTGGAFLGLAFPKHVESRSLRSAPRVRVEIPARLHGPNGGSSSCMILDISRSGCRFEAPIFGVQPGDKLEISCLLPNQSPLVEAPGIVMRSYQGSRFGVEFADLTEKQKTVLEDFLSIFTSVRSLDEGEMGKEGAVGSIEDISLPDLLMILMNSRRCYRLDLKQSFRWGQVYLQDGEVRYATTSQRQGGEAILDLFSWSKGRYRIRTAASIPGQNVYTPLEHLLLEFAYMQDMTSERAAQSASTH